MSEWILLFRSKPSDKTGITFTSASGYSSCYKAKCATGYTSATSNCSGQVCDYSSGTTICCCPDSAWAVVTAEVSTLISSSECDVGNASTATLVVTVESNQDQVTFAGTYLDINGITTDFDGTVTGILSDSDNTMTWCRGVNPNITDLQITAHDYQ